MCRRCGIKRWDCLTGLDLRHSLRWGVGGEGKDCEGVIDYCDWGRKNFVESW